METFYNILGYTFWKKFPALRGSDCIPDLALHAALEKKKWSRSQDTEDDVSKLLSKRGLVAPKNPGDQKKGQKCGLHRAGHISTQTAVIVRFQAGSKSHEMCHIGLFLHPVEEMGHGAFGHDGHILTTMGFGVQGHRSLLVVVILF